ncbi:PEP-CTERM sorting domain-containing protein [Piscinibacter gummiphilus]|uniref:PEP-CTERM sorting domain-containing protein n=1 Tax=Piscinibacter gummiphilus TaxID=946333 RepID=A0ABZ0CRC3_9BURK|nr:PEP-CTERM sorting domain-containing protein [Piscinibacter gummiphilus]WOB07552.1 PEP-CTERM sorting domain-containing protein [Piscinibacter gummiphilus]
MRKTATRLALASSLVTALAPTHAAWIGFDDLPVDDYPDSFWDVYVNPIDPQSYAAQGVILEGGWLWPGGPPLGHSVRVSDDTRITFATTALPTHVSFHATWLPEDILDIRATGPDGYTATFHSWGYEHGPSAPANFGNQRISFSAASGIASLSFGDSRFMRFPPLIDNLYFGNVAAVPEPGPLLLAGIGGLALWARRRATRARPA